MTQLMERAVSTASQLPDVEQDRFAEWLLHEIEVEKRWDETFARNAAGIARLAEQALSDHKAGKTVPLDIDE